MDNDNVVQNEKMMKVKKAPGVLRKFVMK